MYIHKIQTEPLDEYSLFNRRNDTRMTLELLSQKKGKKERKNRSCEKFDDLSCKVTITFCFEVEILRA